MTKTDLGASRTLERIARRGRPRRDESGDTLVEVLVAIVVLSLCGLALLLTFSTSITASVEHRSLATLDTVLRSASESASMQIQQQSGALFSSCATASFYNSNLTLSVPAGYSVAVTSVQYWTGSSFTAFGASCPAGSLQPQLLTMTATAANGVSDSQSFVVDDPLYALGDFARAQWNATLLQWTTPNAPPTVTRNVLAVLSDTRRVTEPPTTRTAGTTDTVRA